MRLNIKIDSFLKEIDMKKLVSWISEYEWFLLGFCFYFSCLMLVSGLMGYGVLVYFVCVGHISSWSLLTVLLLIFLWATVVILHERMIWGMTFYGR